MRPSVSVPVLSKHSTLTRPSASMVDGLRTRAARLDSRRAAASSATVATNGSPSGTAATVRLTAGVSAAASGRPRRRSVRSSTTPEAIDSGRMRLLSSRRRSSTPVGGLGSPASLALRPDSVMSPVATTTARPLPAAIDVPW